MGRRHSPAAVVVLSARDATTVCEALLGQRDWAIAEGDDATAERYFVVWKTIVDQNGMTMIERSRKSTAAPLLLGL